MPSSGRRTIGGGKVRRADVVPGTRGRSTADGRIIDLIDSHFREAGLSGARIAQLRCRVRTIHADAHLVAGLGHEVRRLEGHRARVPAWELRPLGPISFAATRAN